MIKIILNEKEYAEQLIETKSLKFLSNIDLKIMSKYYHHVMHNNSSEIYSKLVEFSEKRYDDFCLPFSQQKFIEYSEQAKDTTIIEIESINITNIELEIISSIKSKVTQRVMFTLLCLAKYKDAVNFENSHWVNYDYGDIFKLANARMSTSEQCKILKQLIDVGFISKSKWVSSTGLRVEIIDPDTDDTAISIFDFRNLGYEYMMYYGGNYTRCRECGILVKDTRNHNKKYCTDCAKTIKYQSDIQDLVPCKHCGTAIKRNGRDKKDCVCENCKNIS